MTDIALVVSDIDGTLVTDDKALTPATVAAVARLGRAGIGFTVVSSRPPVGLRAIARQLDIRLPMGAFNGATLVAPDGAVLSETRLAAPVARAAAAHLLRAGVDVWVFANGAWNLRDPDAPYADLEARTLPTGPTVVEDLDPLLEAASKIVGVSRESDRLAAIEEELARELGTQAAIHRSQRYYLDVTPLGFDKGAFLDRIAERVGVTRERVAAIGDGANDTAMFARAGLAIAMGNASDAVKARAARTTSGNDADGFAQAMDAFVIGGT